MMNYVLLDVDVLVDVHVDAALKVDINGDLIVNRYNRAVKFKYHP